MPLIDDTRLAIGYREIASGIAGTHVKRVPFDLPIELEDSGPCLCTTCKRNSRRIGSAWHPITPPLPPSMEGARSRDHTDNWRRLSFALGDVAADWVCAWVDREAHPDIAMDSVLTVAEAPNLLPNSNHPRQRVWAFIKIMNEGRPRR